MSFLAFILKFNRNIFWKSLNKLAKRLNVFFVFNTRVGIKHLNLSRLVNPGRLTGHIKYLSPNELFLGPDFLKDKYSLLGVPLLESPHYSFVDTLEKGRGAQNTIYFHKYCDAILDWRLWQSPLCDTKRYIEIYRNSKNSIINNNYEPVVVYNLGGMYYIYDGKHRAAVCALLGYNIKCIEVCNTISWGFTFYHLFEMMKSNGLYSKHNSFFKEAIAPLSDVISNSELD